MKNSPIHLRVGDTFITLLRGDITVQETDAIVNAANSSLMGGGGVDGAIHRAGGPRILEECRAIRAAQGELPTGQAVITSGGNMKARHVIHTVGPIWHGGTSGEGDLLASAYRNSLALALSHRCASVAFPSISTGAYGFPGERAASIALRTIRGFLAEHSGLREVRLVVFSAEDEAIYRAVFAGLQ